MSTTHGTTLTRLRQEEHTTLQDLAARIAELQETKVDYVVDTRRTSFSTTEASSLLTFDDEDGGTAGGPLNEHAHGQLAQWLGIPKKYYDRMRGEATTLLDANAQWWLHHPGEHPKRMIRMLEGDVRAILSNRYRRLDNFDLMEQAIIPELMAHESQLDFHLAALTDTRLYVRALVKNREADVRPGVGDIIRTGVEIRNSEVGASALEVAPFIWKLACLNGMVRRDMGISRYHIGREQEESAYAIYKDDTLAADDRAFFLKVRDAVGVAITDTLFDRIVRELREAADPSIRIIEPVGATERLVQRFGLTEDEGRSVLMHLAAGGDLTRWGAANAITRTAQSAEGFDRRADLEAIGGELVALPTETWAQVAQAVAA